MAERFFNWIVDARSEDRPRVFLSFSALFFLLAAYYVLKPVRSSLFLKHWSADELPLAYLVTALTTFVVVWGYNAVAGRFSRHQLLAMTYTIFISGFTLFWQFFRTGGSAALSLAFYVLVSVFSVMTVTLFWSLTNDIFSARDGKRYYGFIASGGILGSVAGAFATRSLARWIGTENLIWVVNGLLLIVAACQTRIRSFEDHADSAPGAKAPEVPPDSGQSGFSLVRRSRYLQLIGAMVVMMTFFVTLVDYEFTKSVEQTIVSKDLRTAYFGTIFTVINSLSWAIQFFLTSRIQRAVGVGPALSVTPVSALGAAVITAAFPTLGTITGLKIVGNSLEYSIYQATKELLYLPLAREVKYKAKAFIDAAFFRLGDAVSALVILFTTTVIHLSLAGFRLINLVVIGLCVWVTWSLRRYHIAALRRVIECRGGFCPADYDAAMAQLAPDVRREQFADDQAIHGEIRAEGRRYALALMSQAAIPSAMNEELSRTLGAETDRIAKRLFRLLSFVHSPEDIWNSANALYLHKRKEDDIALEYLDNVLSFSVRRDILPLFNSDLTLEEKVRHGRRRWGLTPAESRAFLRSFLPQDAADSLAQKAWQQWMQPEPAPARA